jgi:hypothetical protein
MNKYPQLTQDVNHAVCKQKKRNKFTGSLGPLDMGFLPNAFRRISSRIDRMTERRNLVLLAGDPALIKR